MSKKDIDEIENETVEQADYDESNDDAAYEVERSIYRHKRRIRNQVICYLVMILILAALAAGAIFGINKAISYFEKDAQAKELQKQLEELERQNEAEQIAIESPESE